MHETFQIWIEERGSDSTAAEAGERSGDFRAGGEVKVLGEVDEDEPEED